MNIMMLLVPKSATSYLTVDCSMRQGLEKMKFHGYTAIPVLDTDGCYLGTVSEGDFLWNMAGREDFTLRDQENVPISAILRKAKRPPLRIDSDMKVLVDDLLERNFSPVVDDRGKFVGIVTRRDVMKVLSEHYFDTPPDRTEKSDGVSV